jgi:hypothetical protein
MGRRIDMKKFDFTLGFSVMADSELDARRKLRDLLMAIDKEDIFKAMRPVKEEDES